MRKSKTRKTEKKLRTKNAPKVAKELKAKKIATKEKLEAWDKLPTEQWSDARKTRNGIAISKVEVTECGEKCGQETATNA